MAYNRYTIREIQTPPTEGSSISARMWEVWGLLSERVFAPDVVEACTKEFNRQNWNLIGAFTTLAEAEENMRKFIKEIASKVPVFKEYDAEGKEVLTNYD